MTPGWAATAVNTTWANGEGLVGAHHLGGPGWR